MCFHNKGHKESTKDTKEICDWLIGGVWGAALDPGGAAGPHTFVLPAPPARLRCDGRRPKAAQEIQEIQEVQERPAGDGQGGCTVKNLSLQASKLSYFLKRAWAVMVR